MSEDVVARAVPYRLHLRAPALDLFEIIGRRKFRIAFLYSAYVLAVAVAASVFLSQPPSYEASAMIDLQPSAYGLGARQQRLPALRADEVARSQIALLTTESVIRGALAEVGPPPKLPKPALAPMSLPTNGRAVASLVEERAREWLALANKWLFPPLPAADEAYDSARRVIKTRLEPNTSFIRVSFRSQDRAYAIRFLNALIQHFTQKHYELYANVAAVSFFLKHRQESEEDFSRASAELAAFSGTNRIFNIDEQRKLLLQERSRMASSLSDTRDLLAQKESEASTIPDQLAQMKPLTRYSQLNSLAETSKRLAPSPGPDTAHGPIASLGSDPPLLLVKVYQDTIASLVKINTDIAGLKAKLKHQEDEIDDVDRRLSTLSDKEAAFDRLRQKVDLAKATSAQFAQRAVDEQIQQDLNTQKLSTVRVVQPPTPPIEPVWPARMIIAIALAAAILPAFAIAGPMVYRFLFRL
jgi:uncharacterized protein involved in exopolysaccharide biosynthesis